MQPAPPFIWKVQFLNPLIVSQLDPQFHTNHHIVTFFSFMRPGEISHFSMGIVHSSHYTPVQICLCPSSHLAKQDVLLILRMIIFMKISFTEKRVFQRCWHPSVGAAWYFWKWMTPQNQLAWPNCVTQKHTDPWRGSTCGTNVCGTLRQMQAMTCQRWKHLLDNRDEITRK